MTTLQISLTDEIEAKLNRRIKTAGISSKEAYVEMLITQNVTEDTTDFSPGNLFNADRDNNGKGIPIGDFRAMLETEKS